MLKMQQIFLYGVTDCHCIMFVHVRRVVFWLRNDMYAGDVWLNCIRISNFKIIYAAHNFWSNISFFLLENFSLMIIFSIEKKIIGIIFEEHNI